MRECAMPLRRRAGPGFFVNTYLVLLSVFINIWVLNLLALTNSTASNNPYHYGRHGRHLHS